MADELTLPFDPVTPSTASSTEGESTTPEAPVEGNESVDAGLSEAPAQTTPAGDEAAATPVEDSAATSPVQAGETEDELEVDPLTSSSPSTSEDNASEAPIADLAAPSEGKPEEAAPEEAAPEADKAPEPADMAGAPSQGKPIELPETGVVASGEMPQPNDNPPIHPQTMQPLVNDGLGEDVGKVADLGSETDAGQAAAASGVTQSGGESPAAEAPKGADDSSDDDIENNDGAFAHLEGRLDDVTAKIEHLATLIRKLGHKKA